VYNLV